MQLLAENQPWNLLLFMAIPVVLAETVAVTELYILFTKNLTGVARQINKWAGILVGLYFTGVFLYLFKTVVIPLTQENLWRGPADVVAVSFYLLGIVPLLGISLLELNLIFGNRNQEEKLKIHASLVAVFLIVAHIAMIFGMLNPEVLGFNKAPVKTDQHMEMSM